MRKAIVISMLLMAAGQAHAAYQCSVNPQDDVFVSAQKVQITGANGSLIITPMGEVQRNGVSVTVDNPTRQKAVDYQAALRRDLPWIDQGARQRLETSRIAMDKVIVSKLGQESKVRSRLTKLDEQLKRQLNRIIEHRSDGLTFHHKAIEQVRQDGERLVQSAMGGVIQDSLNEMGSKVSGDNPLQAVMGNLGGLQQAVQQQWNNQEADFQNFGHEVCNRITSLESQRKALVSGLK